MARGLLRAPEPAGPLLTDAQPSAVDCQKLCYDESEGSTTYPLL